MLQDCSMAQVLEAVMLILDETAAQETCRGLTVAGSGARGQDGCWAVAHGCAQVPRTAWGPKAVQPAMHACSRDIAKSSLKLLARSFVWCRLLLISWRLAGRRAVC